VKVTGDTLKSLGGDALPAAQLLGTPIPPPDLVAVVPLALFRIGGALSPDTRLWEEGYELAVTRIH